MIANFINAVLMGGAALMFGKTSDTNYLVCVAILFAAAYLKESDNEANDKLLSALFSIEAKLEE